MKNFVFILIAIFGLFSVLEAQTLAGKKILKTSKKLVSAGKKREAVTVLTINKNNGGKYSDEVMLQLGMLQGEILLLDSAIISLNSVSSSPDEEIKAKAKSELEKVNKLKSKYDFNIVLAKAYIRQKDWVTAKISLNETLKYDTGNYEAWFGLAEVAQFTRSVQESLELYIKTSNKYIPGKPELAHVYEHISETYIVMRMNFEAVKAADSAISLDPLSNDAYFFKSKALFNQNDYENSEKSISVYLKHDTQNKHAWNLRGDCYFYQERYSSAIPDYSEAIHLDSAMTEAYSLRAKSYYFTNQYALAELDFEFLNQIFDANYYAKNGLGLCAYQQENYAKAVEYFEQVTTISSQDYYKFNLAMAYYKNKQLKLSLRYFDELAQNFRYEPKYNVAKSWVLLELGEYKKAEAWMNESIKQNPYIKEYFAVRGKIYEKMKETEKADKDARVAHAIEGDPLSFELKF